MFLAITPQGPKWSGHFWVIKYATQDNIKLPSSQSTEKLSPFLAQNPIPGQEACLGKEVKVGFSTSFHNVLSHLFFIVFNLPEWNRVGRRRESQEKALVMGLFLLGVAESKWQIFLSLDSWSGVFDTFDHQSHCYIVLDKASSRWPLKTPFGLVFHGSTSKALPGVHLDGSLSIGHDPAFLQESIVSPWGTQAHGIATLRAQVPPNTAS